MSEVDPMVQVESQITGGRALLKLLRRDLSQIYNVGSSVNKGDNTLLKEFQAMFTRAPALLTDYMSKFENYQVIAITANNESLFPTDEDIKYRNEINALYYKIVEFHQTLSSSHVSNLGSDRSSLNQSLSRSRLPKITLPTFSGVISEWPKFKQLFESIVHENSELPTIEKFHYLCTSITGDPKTLISALTVNEANYKEAWTTLNKRYDNKRLLASSYVERILEYPTHKENSNLASLQDFTRVVVENIRALKNIKINDESDFVWLTIALSKLDPESRRKFETVSVNKEWPLFGDLVEFIQGRCKVLQLSGTPATDSLKSTRPSRFSKPQILTTAVTSYRSSMSAAPKQYIKEKICFCKQTHNLFECPIFRDRSPNQRRKFIIGKNICYNCLRVGHFVSSCSSNSRCRTCQSKHHSLLHIDNPSPSTDQVGGSKAPLTPPPTQDAIQTQSSAVIASVTGPADVLLGTAEILIPDSNEDPQPVRIVIDCCSQVSLNTTSCAKRLGLNWQATHYTPNGVGQIRVPNVKGRLKCTLLSRISPERRLVATPLVVKNITADLPTAPMNREATIKYHPDELADPLFWKTRPIDFLLGNELFMKILSTNPKVVGGEYDALSTLFGLIFMGPSNYTRTYNSNIHCLCLVDSPLSTELMSQFWEIEDIPAEPVHQDTDPCEEHFLRTHYREASGRYVVSLPFKEDPGDLTSSIPLAQSRFRKLEFKLKKDHLLKAKYLEFMKGYEDLGHMSPTDELSAYLIPHHAVFRSNGQESNIRVVFDASMHTDNGSLNEKLLVGPKLQHDITDIILNFRRYVYAVTGDLVKMYRQVLMNPQDRKYQHIVWRTTSGQLQIFALNTVTYGTASAPYLAIRTLRQLVCDDGAPFPRASAALLDESYVDDIMSGANTLSEAFALKNELIQLLMKGGFEVHKWCSNSPDFLSIKNPIVTVEHFSLDPKDSCVRKVLGMSWNPITDDLFYNVMPITQNVTKRGILSVIARLYDPLGLLSPVVFKAKCILQEVWMSKTDWDEEVPSTLAHDWLTFAKQLPSLSSLRIPRFISFASQQECQIVGFCDASQKGFAAALYLHTVCVSGDTKTILLKAKTKLAPIKTISIPRLELSGAHLLVKLVLSIKRLINSMKISKIQYFTDSTIVLSWIKISPHMLQTFVANRVSFITTHSSVDQWFHVPSQENPADVASRGILPELLKDHILWWTPTLRPPEDIVASTHNQEILELRSGVTLVIHHNENWLLSWIVQYSEYGKMIRILAYVCRFAVNCRNSCKDTRLHGELSPKEIDKSLMLCIKAVQRHHFAEDFNWKDGQPTSKRLFTLSAFVDNLGVIRVGGRLQNSELPFNTRCPIILPGDTHLTKIMIDHYHQVHYHLGAQALQATLRRRFWIFRLRQTIRSRLAKCLICFRMKAQPCPPLMGNLPSPRVRPSVPFTNTGVDYAGPFTIKSGTRRNSPSAKAYLALFVCLATKAVHLEAVTSLSTEAFLAAFDRFGSRRGLPEKVFSDCGRNFVGAARRLRELYTWLKQQKNQETIQRHATNKGVHWSFMPPYTPHFGGLWEAGVKSVKHHLHRILGHTPLTFEELGTIFCRVEAILNSRPLCPINDDSTHGDFLTPGHFLTGAPLTALPEEDLSHLKLNTLSRWQLVQNSVQHLWKKWHTEYLHTLQLRPKWYKKSKEIAVGDLVLVSDKTSSPLHWPTARIVKCHPGEDGITRVVSIQTSNGIVRRSLHKLVSLSHLSSQD